MLAEPEAAALRTRFADALVRAGGEWFAVPDAAAAARVVNDILHAACVSSVAVDDTPGVRTLVTATEQRSVFLSSTVQNKHRFAEAGAGVTGALAGIAATGTLVLAASRSTPRSTSLLPPLHIAILDGKDIVGTLAESFARFAAHALPSQIIHITGPSRTGDIEHDLTRGVHGPQRVVVLCLTGAGS